MLLKLSIVTDDVRQLPFLMKTQTVGNSPNVERMIHVTDVSHNNSLSFLYCSNLLLF